MRLWYVTYTFASLTVAVCISLAAVAAQAAGDVRLVSPQVIYRAIDSAHRSVFACAYTVSPASAIVRHLDAANARGVSVTLTVTGSGLEYAENDNDALARASHSLRVIRSHTALHMKAMVVDDAVLYLSDENFSHSGVVLQLPAELYARAVVAAANGSAHDVPPLTLTKSSSLRQEAAIIDHATHSVDLETEYFSDGSPVDVALARAARRGVAIAVVYAYTDDGSVFDRLGIMHASRSVAHDKALVVDGQTAWLGSSNASRGEDSQVDWSFTTRDPAIVAQLLSIIRSNAIRQR